MNRARDLDPLSISMNFSLGWRLYMARQYGLAVQQLRNTLEMDPNFALARMVLGQSYEQQGAYKEAIAELQKAVSISHDSPSMLGSLGHAYGVAGRKTEADEILDHLMRLSKNLYVSPFYVSIVYAGLHENDKAMDWLEKAYEDRSNAIIFLKVDPDFDGLRSDPRFQALLHRLALQ
jgi:tetratricopeptide (TPR) repeat protein